MSKVCAVICSRQHYGAVNIDKINNAIDTAIDFGVDTFYIGLDSQMEYSIIQSIQQLQQTTANITVVVVGAYLPKLQHIASNMNVPTIYPELGSTPYRYRIVARNRWMIDQCCCMIAYAPYNWGGAYKSTQYATKKGRTIVHI